MLKSKSKWGADLMNRPACLDHVNASKTLNPIFTLTMKEARDLLLKQHYNIMTCVLIVRTKPWMSWI